MKKNLLSSAITAGFLLIATHLAAQSPCAGGACKAPSQNGQGSENAQSCPAGGCKNGSCSTGQCAAGSCANGQCSAGCGCKEQVSKGYYYSSRSVYGETRFDDYLDTDGYRKRRGVDRNITENCCQGNQGSQGYQGYQNTQGYQTGGGGSQGDNGMTARDVKRTR